MVLRSYVRAYLSLYYCFLTEGLTRRFMTSFVSSDAISAPPTAVQKRLALIRHSDLSTIHLVRMTIFCGSMFLNNDY